MGVSDEVDKTLFVGNLDTRVTEELLFELFLQAGPVINVKIPKDKDGRPKPFAFVNFKHEVSVPYGMDLLNGTSLFGRPLKIQFRSGSTHRSPDGNSPGSSQNLSSSGTPSPQGGRYDRVPDLMGSQVYSTPPQLQRSYSSPDSLQRQAMVNNMWQKQRSRGFQQQGSQQYRQGSPWQEEGSPHRGHRHHHQQDGGHYSREQRFPDSGSSSGSGSEWHFRGQREDYLQDERMSSTRSRDHPERRRDTSREGRWRQHRYS
ncbi:RNA-binding protein 7 [Lepisosteus oculatus]|uniref:RNA binding motif protein 7 n=1 Tax=Lepisosteus oculatus TaxID=7918 RepID=W5M363_LEPOC|nr:PREDICTED: RNA-binding protein 7 [Lepisosteus oculatus]